MSVIAQQFGKRLPVGFAAEIVRVNRAGDAKDFEHRRAGGYAPRAVSFEQCAVNIKQNQPLSHVSPK
jgi:hypothetical protein